MKRLDDFTVLKDSAGFMYCFEGSKELLKEALRKDFAGEKPFIVDGVKRKTKHSLIEEFSTILSFPDYFRLNWDSFDECLFDYYLENKKKVLVVLEANVLLAEQSAELELLMKIFEDLLKEFKKNENLRNKKPIVIFQVESDAQGLSKFYSAACDIGMEFISLGREMK